MKTIKKAKTNNSTKDILTMIEEESQQDMTALPLFLQIAVRHERECIKLRLKQIEQMLVRISFLRAGMDYGDTFKVVPALKGVLFPKAEYDKAKEQYMKKKVKNENR